MSDIPESINHEFDTAEREYQKNKALRETQQKNFKDNSKKWKLILMCVGVVLLILVIINSLNEIHELNNPVRPLGLQLEDAKLTMFMISLKLEEYRITNACYPDSLDPGMDIYDVDYILHPDGSYMLSCQAGDSTVTFKSTENPGDLVSEDFLSEVVRVGAGE
ncbi:MAG: hypothetical protein K8R76_01385 [Candidatus Aegiribacteria sp.]|nr:hypothetical protein [Candidatus Aegiribacteria sp.]